MTSQVVQRARSLSTRRIYVTRSQMVKLYLITKSQMAEMLVVSTQTESNSSRTCVIWGRDIPSQRFWSSLACSAGVILERNAR